MLPKVVPILERLSAYICMGLILGLRPLLGPAACRYEIGCTNYAIDQLKTQPFAQAVWAIAKRVLACNPLSTFVSGK